MRASLTPNLGPVDTRALKPISGTWVGPGARHPRTHLPTDHPTPRPNPTRIPLCTGAAAAAAAAASPTSISGTAAAAAASPASISSAPDSALIWISSLGLRSHLRRILSLLGTVSDAIPVPFVFCSKFRICRLLFAAMTVC